MPLTKEKKQKIVKDLKDKIAEQKAMILIGITGLNVKDISELRKKLKADKANLKVAKKTLIEKAFEKSDFEGKFDKDKYKEEVALAFGFKDEISLSKIVYQFGLVNGNLKILGGFFQGELKEKEEINALAQLPSREELLAKLVGSVSAPISGFVNVLQGNIKGLLYVLTRIKT